MDALAPGHLLVVLLVALAVLGPSELPKIGRGIARVRREVAAVRRRLDDGVRSILDPDSWDEPAAAPSERMQAAESSGSTADRDG